MKVVDLVRAMEDVAPARLAASWDNVGLIVGDPAADLSRVLLTIDLTRPVLEEAIAAKAEAVVAYHPPIFAAQKRFVAGSVAFEAARAGLAVYSPHTALDVAVGGTNDVLAAAVGMKEGGQPLRSAEALETQVKLVTFVPVEHVEAAAQAVFAAGAGHIGKYSSCSFRTAGTGTFFGDAGADPAVGQAGRLESVAEVRLETVVPLSRLDEVVKALRAAHPYEEPAFDLLRLAPPPGTRGFGCVGEVEAATVAALVTRLKAALGVEHVLVAGDTGRKVTRVAVCAGSGGELVEDAIASGAQLLVTGELRHHDALRVVEAGLVAVCTRHSTSERAALVPLRARLSALLPGVAVTCSAADREPFAFT